MTVAVLGEALIDLIADDDGRFRPHLGGSPYNVAIGLARQGVTVSYLPPLSDDAFGDRLLEDLCEEGVDVPQSRRSLRPTSIAIVTLGADGQPAYRLYREGIADKDITFEEIVDHLPDGLRVFHTGSLAITPSQLPKLRRVFALLRDRGVCISLDVNIRLRASFDTAAYLAGVRSFWPLADIVKASDEDLAPFELGATPREGAERVFDEMGAGMLVLTEGQAGAVLYARNARIERPCYPVDRVADTVGAGDTFHAAFLAALCRSGALHATGEGEDAVTLGDALDVASAAAAINVSRAGCSPPTREEVDAYRDKVGRDPV